MSHIHAEIYGQGRPLVMLHGWAMHSGVWRDFARLLAKHCQVICLDLPGHGRSDAIEPFTLETVSETLLEAIPVERFCLLGWSLGATVAMKMAERSPERVEKLLVLAGNPRFVQDADWPGVRPGTLDGFSALLKSDLNQTLVRFLALQVNGLAHGKQLLQILKKALQEYSAPPAEVLQAGLDVLKTSDLRECMLSTRIPTAMIMGGKDLLVPAESALKVAQGNPNVDVKILESAGHAPFLSHPDQLLAAILERL